MDKVYRTGLDVRVALAVAGKGITLASVAPPSMAAPVEVVAVADTPAAAPARSWRTIVKRASRQPAKIIFRLIKPFLSPLTFRTRRYLAAEIQHDLLRYHIADQHAIERVSADMLRETQASREMLRLELLGAQQQTILEQRLAYQERVDQAQLRSPQLLQPLFERISTEIRATRDLLREELIGVQHAYQERVAERLLPLLERISTEINSSRELLRHELITAQAQFEQRIEAMEARSEQRLLALAADMRQSTPLAAMAAHITPRFDVLEQYAYATARRVIIPCGPDRVLIKTEAGFVLCPVSDLSIIACLADTGDLERGTRVLIQRLLEPGAVFVDVGANLGIHTLAAATAMHGQGKIVAFEPFDTTCRLLEETVRINGHAGITQIHQAAVSDQAGQHALYLGKSSGHHSLYALAQEDATDVAPVAVRTVRLDEVLGQRAPVTLIKIDAEGAELEVLRGAAATVAANPEIGLIVEFGMSHLTRNHEDAGHWLAQFESLGLEYRAIDPATGALECWSLAQLAAVDSINLFFARPGAAIWNKAEAA